MSKHPKISADEIARRVAKVTTLGYSVKQFETFHFRFEGKVDFWPSTFRWSDISGEGRRWRLTQYGIQAKGSVSV